MDHNPDHERSPLLHLTDHGRETLTTITTEARRWHEHLAPSLHAEDLAAARRVLRALATSSD